MPRKKTDDTLDFEKALEELEQLVERLEDGDQPLETALAEFERGIQLTRQCQQALRDAEQKVRLLTETGEERGFTAGEDADD